MKPTMMMPVCSLQHSRRRAVVNLPYGVGEKRSFPRAETPRSFLFLFLSLSLSLWLPNRRVTGGVEQRFAAVRRIEVGGLRVYVLGWSWSFDQVGKEKRHLCAQTTPYFGGGGGLKNRGLSLAVLPFHFPLYAVSLLS
jgi:hypothetical protein